MLFLSVINIFITGSVAYHPLLFERLTGGIKGSVHCYRLSLFDTDLPFHFPFQTALRLLSSLGKYMLAGVLSKPVNVNLFQFSQFDLFVSSP
jgi:hypothetical protein